MALLPYAGLAGVIGRKTKTPAKYSPMRSRSVSSYGKTPSRYKTSTSGYGGLPTINIKGRGGSVSNILGGGATPSPGPSPGSGNYIPDLYSVDKLIPQSNPGQINWSGIYDSLFKPIIQGLFGDEQQAQQTPYRPSMFSPSRLNSGRTEQQIQSIIDAAQPNFQNYWESGGGATNPEQVWQMLQGNMNNPALQSGMILGHDFREFMPQGEFGPSNPGDDALLESLWGKGNQTPYGGMFEGQAPYFGSSQGYGEGEYPEVPGGDPNQQAMDYIEWMRQQRISGVNTAIDQYLEQLDQEQGRVGPYYEALNRNLGVTRDAALEGSAATEAGTNREYTRDRLGLVDLKDQMRQDTQSNLAARGMLNSGAADKAFRNIDKIITSSIEGAMKDKNIKISDILEGKENVQQIYTTAIKDAQEQQQQYLEGLEKEKSAAERQRGQEILNIGNELAAQLPVLSRELSNDKFNQQMQVANMLNNYRMASMGGGSSGPSWNDQAMMKFRYDQLAQQMALAQMENQQQPNWEGLYRETSGMQPNQLSSIMNNPQILANALNMDPQMLMQMLYGYGLGEGYQLTPGEMYNWTQPQGG